MKAFLLSAAALILITACSEETPQKPATETKTQQEFQGTPSSLSGSERHLGPDPHAKLSSEQHISVALQHAEEGRMDEALDILARAIIASPKDASLVGALGGLLLSQDRVVEALEYLEEAVALAPNSAVLLVNRSQAYRKLNRPQEAKDDLNRAVDLSPNLVPARFNRGVLLYDEGKHKEALADFDTCIQIAPDTAGPYFNRAVTRNSLGDNKGAVSDMNKFIELADNPEWKKVAEETLAAWEKDSK